MSKIDEIEKKFQKQMDEERLSERLENFGKQSAEITDFINEFCPEIFESIDRIATSFKKRQEAEKNKISYIEPGRLEFLKERSIALENEDEETIKKFSLARDGMQYIYVIRPDGFHRQFMEKRDYSDLTEKSIRLFHEMHDENFVRVVLTDPDNDETYQGSEVLVEYCYFDEFISLYLFGSNPYALTSVDAFIFRNLSFNDNKLPILNQSFLNNESYHKWIKETYGNIGESKTTKAPQRGRKQDF